MLPVLLAQDQGKAETCSYLAGKISKLDEAITFSVCDLTGLDFAKLVIPTVCQTVSMTAIPPCMVKVGKAAQDQCMVEATKVIIQEYNAPEEEMTIVEQCKCNAFGKSRYNLAKVQEMLDCSSSAARNRRGAPTQHEPVHHQPQPVYSQPQQAYYQPHPVYHQPQQAFGADTLWFQYSLCQDKDFSCYFFSNHWSQGDFGQYYLYDNLLSGEDGLFGGDNSLLPLLAMGGGGGNSLLPLLAMGGGDNSLLPLLAMGGGGGGHGSMNTILPLLLLNRERRGADCEAGSMENFDGDCVTCPDGTTLNAAKNKCVDARKRRSTCPLGHVDCVCPVGTTLNAVEDKCVDARKRRSTCPLGHVDCVCPVGTTLNAVEDKCVDARKRRSTCPLGHVDCVCPVGTTLNATEDKCVKARKRRAVGLVCDEGGTELDADFICDGTADCNDGADEAVCY